MLNRDLTCVKTKCFQASNRDTSGYPIHTVFMMYY